MDDRLQGSFLSAFGSFATLAPSQFSTSYFFVSPEIGSIGRDDCTKLTIGLLDFAVRQPKSPGIRDIFPYLGHARAHDERSG